MRVIEICNESLCRLMGARPDRDITGEDLRFYIDSSPHYLGELRQELLCSFFISQAEKAGKGALK